MAIVLYIRWQLLTRRSKFEHPADQKTLCCKDASQVKSYIGDLCPAGDKADALTAFKTACEEAGYGCMLHVFALAGMHELMQSHSVLFILVLLKFCVRVKDHISCLFWIRVRIRKPSTLPHRVHLYILRHCVLVHKDRSHQVRLYALPLLSVQPQY